MEQIELGLQHVHCPWCDRFRGAASPGSTVELKCPHCKRVFRHTLPNGAGASNKPTL